MAAQIRRDLYAEVTSRILAELDRGAAPWVKPWSATPGQNIPQNAVTNRPYSGCNVILLWFTHGRGWPTPRFVTFKQAQEAGGSVRKGEHGTKVYFVKRLRITEGEGEAEAEHLVPMMREYTVFNVAQCEGLPASIIEGKLVTPRGITSSANKSSPASSWLKGHSLIAARSSQIWLVAGEQARGHARSSRVGDFRAISPAIRLMAASNQLSRICSPGFRQCERGVRA